YEDVPLDWLIRSELVERFRPILLEQAGQGSIGKKPAAGLAARAVVRLVLGVPDALHRTCANGTRQPEAAVNRHVVAEGRYLLGELSARERPQTLRPEPKLLARGRVQALDLRIIEPARQHDRRQPRGMQNLIGVGVADPAEQSRVGERAFERMVLAPQPLRELRETRFEDLDAARVLQLQIVLPLYDVKRGPTLGSGFGQRERAALECKLGQHRAAPPRRTPLEPVQAARDHQMQDQPKIALEPDRDALSNAPHLGHPSPDGRCGGRYRGAQEEGRVDPQPLETLPENAAFQRLDVDREIG